MVTDSAICYNQGKGQQNKELPMPEESLPILHFFDEPVEVWFDTPPVLEKSPPCPQGFTWQGQAYPVVEALAEWRDFRRRGRMAQNMRPSHAEAAAGHGSWGVGRFFFRVRVANGQVFELYYDRAPGKADDRKGHWFLFAERQSTP